MGGGDEETFSSHDSPSDGELMSDQYFSQTLPRKAEEEAVFQDDELMGGSDDEQTPVFPHFQAKWRRDRAFREVLKCYDDLQVRIEDIAELKTKIRSYSPGTWVEEVGGLKCSDYQFPQTTCLLIIGPKGSGKSSLVNKISRIFEDDKFAPDRAQISYSCRDGDGTCFLREYMIPRSSNAFCLYDTRGLSDYHTDNAEEIKLWMTKGVGHGELLIRGSDGPFVRKRMKSKARSNHNQSIVKRSVNFVVFVVDGLSVLASFEGKKSEETNLITQTYDLPYLSFNDDKPAVVVTHGDLLSIEERARVRVHLGKLLGIPPTKQVFDIPDISDQATELAILKLLRYSLEHADRSFPRKTLLSNKLLLGITVVVFLLRSADAEEALEKVSSKKQKKNEAVELAVKKEKVVTKTKPKKKESSSSSDDSSSEEEVKVKIASKNGKAVAKTPVESSSDSSSSDDEPAPPKKQTAVAKNDTAKAPAKKSQPSSSSESSDDDSEDEKPTKAEVPVKKAAEPKKVEEDSSSDSSDDESDEAPKPKVTLPTKQAKSDSSSSDSDSEDEKVNKVPVETKKSAKKSTDVDMVDASPAANGKQQSESKAPQTPATPQGGGSKTLFTGNLPFSVERENIVEFFKNAGEVVDVRFATDQEGNFRGFGHVEFASVEDAKKAFELNGEYLNNCRVKLDFAREKGAYTPGGDSNPRQQQAKGHTVFIRGFDRSLGEQEVKIAAKNGKAAAKTPVESSSDSSSSDHEPAPPKKQSVAAKNGTAKAPAKKSQPSSSSESSDDETPTKAAVPAKKAAEPKKVEKDSSSDSSDDESDEAPTPQVTLPTEQAKSDSSSSGSDSEDEKVAKVPVETKKVEKQSSDSSEDDSESSSDDSGGGGGRGGFNSGGRSGGLRYGRGGRGGRDSGGRGGFNSGGRSGGIRYSRGGRGGEDSGGRGGFNSGGRSGGIRYSRGGRGGEDSGGRGGRFGGGGGGCRGGGCYIF